MRYYPFIQNAFAQSAELSKSIDLSGPNLCCILNLILHHQICVLRGLDMLELVHLQLYEFVAQKADPKTISLHNPLEKDW